MEKEVADIKIKVGLSQIGDCFGGQYYFPYSVGLLQSYAIKKLSKPEKFQFLLPLYKRLSLDYAVDYFSECSIVFFSVYIWNFQISLNIAKSLKMQDRNCTIVFGGPQVPEDKESLYLFLKNYDFIDLVCSGEGEIKFLNILENFPDKNWNDIPGISFFNQSRKFFSNFKKERVVQLDSIPSPYLNGVFDGLIEAYPGEKWSALLETNRGCPFSCTFCYWGKKDRSKVYFFPKERIFKEIDWFSRKKIEFVFCCDANFGLFQLDFDIVDKIINNKKECGYPCAFSVQNTKKSTQKIFALQKSLTDSGLQKGVNLAFQSLNRDTLMSIKRRNIPIEDYKELQLLFTENKISTFSDIILGLPDETYETFTAGVEELIQSGQHNRIQFINLALLENTAMADPEYIKKYGLVIKEIKLIPHHTNIDENGIFETQRIVVGSKVLSTEEWLKMRVFCWMTALLYFNKLLQIPFVILTKTSKVKYRQLVEFFMDEQVEYRIISEIRNFFIQKAEDIKKGECEFVASKEWLNIWWPIDEYMFIDICLKPKFNAFYDEAESLIAKKLKENNLDFSTEVLREAILLNKALIKLPYTQENLRVTLHYNIFELYRNILETKTISLRNGLFEYLIDRASCSWPDKDAWLKEVIWYGRKRGAYLYDCRRLNLSCEHAAASVTKTNILR